MDLKEEYIKFKEFLLQLKHNRDNYSRSKLIELIDESVCKKYLHTDETFKVPNDSDKDLIRSITRNPDYKSPMTRKKAKKMAQSRNCKCVKGKDRDSNYNECIDKIFDYLERKQKREIIEFGKWLRILDNGSGELGYSPYELFIDDDITVEKIYNLYKNKQLR